MEYNKVFRASRIAALQEMFSNEFNADAIEDSENGLLQRTLASRDIVNGVQENKEAIDALITKYASKNWTIERMNKIDVNILRVAIYELKFAKKKIEASIIINEAIELAKEYGTEKSYKFVNGLLDAFVKNEQNNG